MRGRRGSRERERERERERAEEEEEEEEEEEKRQTSSNLRAILASYLRVEALPHVGPLRDAAVGVHHAEVVVRLQRLPKVKVRRARSRRGGGGGGGRDGHC